MAKTFEQLQELVSDFKALTLTMSAAAGSGHVGGALSGAESMVAVWFDKFNLDIEDQNWDRFFSGPMHFTPGIYSLLVKKGYLDWKETARYRWIGSPFEGHPNVLKIKGWELSGSSLGQALGVAVGSAMAAKICGKKHWIMTHNSGGEWALEAAAQLDASGVVRLSAVGFRGNEDTHCRAWPRFAHCSGAPRVQLD